MQIPDCYDPVCQEELRQLGYTARMMKRPCCVCCGGRIWSERYLDLEPFGLKGYACEQCLKKHMGYTDNLEEN